MSGLIKLKDRAHTAVPALIELLKSDDPEFKIKEDVRFRAMIDFTRDNVIQTLGAIGPPAKDALPILEAELETLDKKAKEDALLSGNTPQSRFGYRPEPPTASKLRIAIAAIKGERPVGRGRPTQSQP